MMQPSLPELQTMLQEVLPGHMQHFSPQERQDEKQTRQLCTLQQARLQGETGKHAGAGQR